MPFVSVSSTDGEPSIASPALAILLVGRGLGRGFGAGAGMLFFTCGGAVSSDDAPPTWSCISQMNNSYKSITN